MPERVTDFLFCDINPLRDFRYFPSGIDMCFALDMRCDAREDLYHIEHRRCISNLPQANISSFPMENISKFTLQVLCEYNITKANGFNTTFAPRKYHSVKDRISLYTSLAKRGGPRRNASGVGVESSSTKRCV